MGSLPYHHNSLYRTLTYPRPDNKPRLILESQDLSQHISASRIHAQPDLRLDQSKIVSFVIDPLTTNSRNKPTPTARPTKLGPVPRTSRPRLPRLSPLSWKPTTAMSVPLRMPSSYLRLAV